MQRNTEEETRVVEKIESEKQSAEIIRDDRCPHCGAMTSTYPYTVFNPIHGWLECAVCGIVFSPLSVRKQKLEECSKLVRTPKLVIPA